MGQNRSRINENEFFREATVRICGDLDFGVALVDCIRYCAEYLPLERYIVLLASPIEELREMDLVVDADARGVITTNVRVPLDEEFRELLRKLRQNAMIRFGHEQDSQAFTIPQLTLRAELPPEMLRSFSFSEVAEELPGAPQVSLISDVHANRLTGEMARLLRLPEVPALSMRLHVGEAMFGVLVATYRRGVAFEPVHAQLLSSISRPFTVALVNSRRYHRLNEFSERLADENRFLHEELNEQRGLEVIGSEFGLRRTMQMVRQVAPTDSPVLLLGETGVGKEVIAGAVHLLSSRSQGPLISVNCGAIPQNLIDSDLFGHEKGAFTGAFSRTRGKFERANGGTIFLDEIGELPLDVQVRLLRVLQDKRFERVGGGESVQVDIRIIAATHRDLLRMIEEGRFREDLYFRLNVFPIVIPPLRERVVDIAPLAYYFLEKKAREMKLRRVPPFAPGAIEVLAAHTWPGNVRELENVVERALIVSAGEALRFDTLLQPSAPPAPAARLLARPAELRFDDVVAAHIRAVLDLAGGRVHGEGGAAELLGLNPSTLRKKMRRLGIPFGRSARRG